MDDMLEKEQLEKIMEAFYQMHPLQGVVRVYFTIRKMPDSDGQSIINAHVEAMNTQALENMESFASNKIQNEDQGCFQIQMLEECIPANLLGYEYIIELEETPVSTALRHVSIKNVRKVMSRSRETEGAALL